MRAPLPIDAALPELIDALERRPNAVLQAPPGAGKTTRAPLALYERARWRGDGAILMLQPRRVAARAAAARLADELGEPVGQTVGYRIRGEAKRSSRTRIEVLTEGILTRRLQNDPGLEGVAAVLFDEFHERSIHADLGLALCLEAQAALRPELRLLAMSATLDGEAVAALMDAQIVTSEGRSFEVETRWRDAPLPKERRAPGAFEAEVAETALRALAEAPGDALIFLPGAAEIGRTTAALEPRVGGAAHLLPLHGGLPFAEQRRALAPAPGGARKVVLATNIAETSLTIDGVRIVVDAGLSRRARFDPGVGMDRLKTGPASRAASAQRRGRAGRTAPGVCWRLWSRGEDGARPAFDAPEIIETDLAGFALELAAWGAEPAQLALLDPPPEASFEQARALLRDLKALDAAGRLTDHGRALAAIPLHPRLAEIVHAGGGDALACRLASLLEARDPMRGQGADIALRLSALCDPGRAPAARGALERVDEAAKTLRKRVAVKTPARERDPAALLALGYPDRVAARRPGQKIDPGGRTPVRYATVGGRGAEAAPSDPLAKHAFLAVAEMSFPEDARRGGGDPQIALAAPLSRAEIERLFADRIEEARVCEWSKREERVLARRERRLGGVVLESATWTDAPADAVSAAMLEGVRQLGLSALPWSGAAERLRARIARARATGAAEAAGLPDFSDDALSADLAAWLGLYLSGLGRRADLKSLDMAQILGAQLDYAAKRTLDELLPEDFVAPSGARAAIDYAGDAPVARIRIQALYGLSEHPRVAGAPLLLELLSPADRPIQRTADLPGFWAGSYADVRKDMRARYPKHSWPEDPATAAPPAAKRR